MTTLMDVHGKLAELSHAVALTLEPLAVTVEVVWRPVTYLAVEIKCYARDSQIVVDRLRHGALADKYDYRFTSIARPLGRDPFEWITISAVPDMQHDRRKELA
jgi:hypothetical protein